MIAKNDGPNQQHNFPISLSINLHCARLATGTQEYSGVTSVWAYLYSFSLRTSTGSIPFGFCTGASLGFGGLFNPGNFFCKAFVIAAVASLAGIVAAAAAAATTEVEVDVFAATVVALEEDGGCAVVEETGVGVRLVSLTGDLTGVLLPLERPPMKC